MTLRVLLVYVLGVLLAGCVPQTGGGKEPEYEVLPEGEYTRLLGAFRPALAQIGVQTLRGTAYAAPTNDDNALIRAVNRFYRENPGFCPLQENAFQGFAERGLFMMVTARGRALRLLIYDRSDPTRLRYAFVEADSAQALLARACRTAG